MSNSFHQLTASIISQLATLSQLKYQTQTTLPTTMLVGVSSMMLYYLLHIGLLRSPMSRFAAVAQHLLVCSAYVAVSTLAAALFPDSATPYIYTLFGLLSTGQVLYVFRDKLAIDDKDEDEEEEGEASRFKVFTRFVCRLLKNMWCSVVKFIGQQPPPVLLPN